MSASKRQVVITGVGIASPHGYELEPNMQAVWSGQGRFTAIEHQRAAETPVKYQGACIDPDPKRLPDRKVQKILRRKDVISLLTILETARSAGVSKGTLDPDRTGMYVGASSTQIADLEPYFALVNECVQSGQWTFDATKFGDQLMSSVNPLVVLQTLMNNSLCFGAMGLDIRGVNANFMDFQAAGLRAVGEGVLSIMTGRADHVLAGGVSNSVEPFQVQEGVEAGYLAKTRDLPGDPKDMVRPYDKARQGTIMSEGAAYILLEEEAVARQRGAKILARVSGYSLGGDGSNNIMGAHESPGLARSAHNALTQAGINAKDLGLIVGHGSGWNHGDRAEARVWTELLGNAAGSVPLTSPKSILGDMCEAGGVAGLIVAMESLRRQEAPPTRNFTSGDEYSTKLAISSGIQPVSKSHALVTARSFLGLSVALIITAA